ncbi:MAG: hypothetical protein ABIT10_01805 [Alteraurantiacibacter sp.]
MLKLYRSSEVGIEYWEAWDDGSGGHLVHWGKLGTRGETKTLTSSLFKSALAKLKQEADAKIEAGFLPVELEDHAILMIEYCIEGMGSEVDLAKRHTLEDRLNETLGWTGLGACDGGSIGSGTMEVCNFVVDFDTAKQVIEGDLAGTEFADYTRIYLEHAA